MNTPSIAAIVSTTDKYCYQFPAVLKVNTARKEMVDREQLGQMVKKCLERWKPGPSDPQGLPHNIIIYRDGVSEGQYTQTVELEYTSIREACAAYYTKKQRKGEPTAPKISIIVCGKRHNTRFYPSDNNLDFTSGKTGTSDLAMWSSSDHYLVHEADR